MLYVMKFLREEEAATAVEYAVMLALILMVAIGAVSTLGAEGGGLWTDINTDLGSYDTFGAGYSGGGSP